MKNNKLVDVYEIAKNGKLKQVPVTTQHDLNTNDSSAEYVFEIDSIKMAPDFSRFIISQGMYGVTDLLLK